MHEGPESIAVASALVRLVGPSHICAVCQIPLWSTSCGAVYTVRGFAADFAAGPEW